MTYGLDPGPQQPVAFKSIPRGELQATTIIIPPDPTARRAAPKVITADTVQPDLVGLWNVNIGSWKGLFQFEADGTMSWAESLKAIKHYVRWWVAAEKIEFQILDDPPGQMRHWRITTGLYLKEVKGCVLPEGVNGFFEMSRAKWWNANSAD